MKYFILSIFSILFAFNLAYSQKASELTIIGNKTGFENSSLKEIKQIFKGKYSNWPTTGVTVTIVLPDPRTSNAQKVAAIIYENTVSGVQKYWLSLVFQGRANPPVFLETDEQIIEMVKKTPGAVGVISSSYSNIPKTMVINIVN